MAILGHNMVSPLCGTSYLCYYMRDVVEHGYTVELLVILVHESCCKVWLHNGTLWLCCYRNNCSGKLLHRNHCRVWLHGETSWLGHYVGVDLKCGYTMEPRPPATMWEQV